MLLLTRVKAFPCGAFPSVSHSPPLSPLSLLFSEKNFLPRVLFFSSYCSIFSRFFLFDQYNPHSDILIMEGNFGSETRHRPPLPLAANIGCNHDLTRSNSDASSLTAENCKDIFRRSANVTPDDCTAWTDEKHNLYLHHLEMSFVKQLHQSKSSLAQCSEQNQRDINISQKRLNNKNNASEQFNVLRNGCQRKINCVRGAPLCSSTSADSRASLKSKRMYNFKHPALHRHPSSAEMPAFLKLFSTGKQGKGMISNGIPTCSPEFSSFNPYDGDLIDLTREGMGQNFLDEGNQSTSNFESQAKRLKTALGDGSHQDQIVPFRKCPTADYSVINSSTHGEELVRCESVSH